MNSSITEREGKVTEVVTLETLLFLNMDKVNHDMGVKGVVALSVSYLSTTYSLILSSSTYKRPLFTIRRLLQYKSLYKGFYLSLIYL